MCGAVLFGVDTAGRLMQLEERVVGEVTIIALSGRMIRNDHFGD